MLPFESGDGERFLEFAPMYLHSGPRTIALLPTRTSLTPHRSFASNRGCRILRRPAHGADAINNFMSNRSAAIARQSSPAARRPKTAAPAPARANRAKQPAAPGRWEFFNAFLREPLKVGAFLPSSRELSERIVAGCDLPRRELVVELGPGTGAFTSLILERMNKRSHFFAIELSQTNARLLRRRFPRVQVFEDSAERLGSYLELRDGQRADCIISGLAWGNMMPATQNKIFDAVLDSLAPGGLFTTFAYIHARWLPTSLRFRKRLFQHFKRVETTPIVWKNLPPAFVYRCWKD